MMTDNFENTLDDIRIKLNEQAKGMSNKAAADAVNANAKKIAEKYGMKIAKAVSIRPPKAQR
jgi:hypothetical protein